MIPLRKLGEKANEVSIGDVIELDDRIGIIRFIGSGRVQVDFNHRYAGRTLVYDANIVKKLDNDNEKITNLIHRRLPIELTEIKFENKNSDLEIDLPRILFMIEGIQIIKRGISLDIFKFLPSIKSVIFLEKYDNTASKNEATPEGDDATNETSKGDDATNETSKGDDGQTLNNVSSNAAKSNVKEKTKEAVKNKSNMSPVLTFRWDQTP